MDADLPTIPTHVEGLDKALGGGVPAGSIVLVAGTPGTMKSSMVFNVLYHNAQQGRKGLYISLEQSSESLLLSAARMGMKDAPESNLYVLDMGRLRLEFHNAETSKDWIEILVRIIREAVEASGYDILAIDSLEALYGLVRFDNPRQELFHLFGALKDLGLTTFLISETRFGSSELSRFGEDFLADGILLLRQVEVGDTEVQLRLRCVKMRMMRHDANSLLLMHDYGRLAVTHVITRKTGSGG